MEFSSVHPSVNRELSVADRLYSASKLKTKTIATEKEPLGEHTARLINEFNSMLNLPIAFSKRFHFNDEDQRKYRMHKFLYEKVNYTNT